MFYIYTHIYFCTEPTEICKEKFKVTDLTFPPKINKIMIVTSALKKKESTLYMGL